MTVSQIPKELQALLGATHRVNVKAADVAGIVGTTSGTLKPFPALAAGNYMKLLCWNLKTNFSGGSTSDMTMSAGIIGLTTSATRLVGANSVHASGTFIPTFPANGASIQAAMTVDQATDITLTFTSTGGNLSTITAGEIDIFFQIVPLVKLVTT